MNKTRILKNYYETALNWLFPKRCPICDEILEIGKDLICVSCKPLLVPISDPICIKCGKPLEDETEELCQDCKRRAHYFVRGRALYSYKSIAASLYRFKYQGRAEYADFYAREIAKHLGKEIKTWGVDAIVPVPLHKDKQRTRGYNQAEELAIKLGHYLQIPVSLNLIKRVRKTTPQKQLNSLERQNNLKKAFKICQDDVKLKTIIIVDDIFTTGSTIDAMMIELIKNQVNEAYFITLAIGEGLS